LEVLLLRLVATTRNTSWLNAPLTSQLTDSMQQSLSSETNPPYTSQKILHILWNVKVNYSDHNSPPLFPILSQISPNHGTHSISSILILSCQIHLSLSSHGPPKADWTNLTQSGNLAYAWPALVRDFFKNTQRDNTQISQIDFMFQFWECRGRFHCRKSGGKRNYIWFGLIFKIK